MIGGAVVGVVRYGDGTPTLLHVAGTGHEEGDRCCIRVSEHATLRPIAPNDRVWWQGAVAFWSAENCDFRNIPLVRIGHSFAHPAGQS